MVSKQLYVNYKHNHKPMLIYCFKNCYNKANIDQT